jgi:cytochrome P450
MPCALPAAPHRYAWRRAGTAGRVTVHVPPGPSAGRLAQTVALHRDPLAFLRAQQGRFGDVFSLRLATTGPVVVVADAMKAAGIPEADPGAAHAGAARRSVLPMASSRSVFGSDGAEHDRARARVADAFAPEHVAARADAITAIAGHHLVRWPRGAPLRVLPRMRAIADEVFVREVLGVRSDHAPALARAIGSLLWTPGNPPVTIPGPRDGLMGRLVDAEYRRRRAPVADLIVADLARRRGAGIAGEGVLGRLVAAEPQATPDALVEELLALLMAAQEPMAAALTWLLLRIAADAGVHERLREEGLDSSFGRAVVLEALRLHPPAIASLREAVQPLAVDGHVVEPGVVAMVPLPVIQRDARYVEDPDAFRPERHLGDRAGAPPPEALLPFGRGGRRCLGEALAWTEIAAILPAVLHAARWRPLGPQPERMVLRATILVPQRAGLVFGS